MRITALILPSLLGLVVALAVGQALASANWRLHDPAVLTDPTGTETLDSVSRPERAAEFEPRPHGFSAGYTRHVHWLRFTLQPPPADAAGQRRALLAIQPPLLDDLRLYLPRQPEAPQGFVLRRGGDWLPFTAREYPYREFVYSVVFPDDQPLTAYLRLQTTSSAWMVIRVLDPDQFVAIIAWETLLFGLCFGLLIAAILTNLWHGLWLRQTLYRRFLLYLVAALTLLFSVNGFLAQFVLPAWPWLADRWTSVNNLLLIAAMAHFFAQALEIDSGPWWLRWVYQGTRGWALLSLPSPFMGWYTEAMRVLVLAALVMLTLGSLRSLQLWWRHRLHGLLFLAHVFTLLGALSTGLVLNGWLPGQLLAYHGFQIGLLGSLMVLQILLAQRISAIARSQTKDRLLAERARAEARMKHERLEHQRDFMRMLTHELKTPLSVIRLRLDAASPSERMQARAREAVGDIDAILDRCAMSARLEDTALEVRIECCDLVALLNRRLATEPEAARIRFESQLPPEACRIRTDPTLLRTVLANLLDNALKYSPPGTPIAVAVSASCNDERAGVCLSIVNSLPAGADLCLEQLFEKYYRASDAYRVSGSGLGLYIVRALVSRLGGDIRCHRDENSLCFELWLPTKTD